MKDTVTDRQAIILATLDAFYGRHGYPPTVRQIAKALGLSVSTVHGHLRALLRKGKVRSAGSRGYLPAPAEDAVVISGRWQT